MGIVERVGPKEYKKKIILRRRFDNLEAPDYSWELAKKVISQSYDGWEFYHLEDYSASDQEELETILNNIKNLNEISAENEIKRPQSYKIILQDKTNSKRIEAHTWDKALFIIKDSHGLFDFYRLEEFMPFSQAEIEDTLFRIKCLKELSRSYSNQ
jgi:hypothetical protein